ncbi:hypothetical protein [Mitsuaria sp. GD03876]|uniref:hypothetical protein n=1 Tax=Mitsuaria sp. GD03876 TaxID=2975399 RepID=UPI002448525E|nr:hypothetical protein [Mitsuaria sp. GD03876]MDH0866743.1 hypothetical protein [Mitsuaria sp. GD03876]
METLATQAGASGLSQRQLISLVRRLLGAMPDRDDTPPPAPWDAVLSRVGKRLLGTRSRLTLPPPEELDPGYPPRPPWLFAVASSPDLAALNPQPLPPRWAFAATLADELIQRAAQADEWAAWAHAGDDGRIRVGARLLSQVDELCGNDLRLHLPRPRPEPPGWQSQLGGVDLIVMGLQFEDAAAHVPAGALQRAYASGGAKLVQAGWSRSI